MEELRGSVWHACSQQVKKDETTIRQSVRTNLLLPPSPNKQPSAAVFLLVVRNTTIELQPASNQTCSCSATKMNRTAAWKQQCWSASIRLECLINVQSSHSCGGKKETRKHATSWIDWNWTEDWDNLPTNTDRQTVLFMRLFIVSQCERTCQHPSALFAMGGSGSWEGEWMDHEGLTCSQHRRKDETTIRAPVSANELAAPSAVQTTSNSCPIRCARLACMQSSNGTILNNDSKYSLTNIANKHTYYSYYSTIYYLHYELFVYTLYYLPAKCKWDNTE